MADGLTTVQMRIAAIQRQFAPASVQTKPTETSSQGSAGMDFAALLDSATTKAASAASATTTVDTSSYSNGKLPSSALVSIGGGESLVAPAARSFTDLRSAAQRDGVSFAINDSYRSYDDQVAMAKSKGLYSQGGLAAAPGTSTHGKGVSVDLQLDAKAQSWMKSNADTYGWVNDVANEPWHWTYKP